MYMIQIYKHMQRSFNGYIVLITSYGFMLTCLFIILYNENNIIIEQDQCLIHYLNNSPVEASHRLLPALKHAELLLFQHTA